MITRALPLITICLSTSLQAAPREIETYVFAECPRGVTTDVVAGDPALSGYQVASPIVSGVEPSFSEDTRVGCKYRIGALNRGPTPVRALKRTVPGARCAAGAGAEVACRLSPTAEPRFTCPRGIRVRVQYRGPAYLPKNMEARDAELRDPIAEADGTDSFYCAYRNISQIYWTAPPPGCTKSGVQVICPKENPAKAADAAPKAASRRAATPSVAPPPGAATGSAPPPGGASGDARPRNTRPRNRRP